LFGVGLPKRAGTRKRKLPTRAPKRFKPGYIDAVKFVDDYLGMQDWRVREKAKRDKKVKIFTVEGGLENV